MSFATITESENPITDNLYSEGFGNLNNYKEAIDMETYHTEMYNLQVENARKNRIELENDAKKRLIDFNNLARKIKERYEKYKEQQNEGWKEIIEKDPYWKHYFENIDKTGYTEMDNYLDKMDETKFFPVNLSNDYQEVGDFDNNVVNDSIIEVKNPNTYKTHFGEYLYDYVNDKLHPYKENYNPNIKNVEPNNKNNINSIFKLKEEQINKNEKNETKETKETNKTKEDFYDVDPKLSQIYQKTLPPSEYKYNNGQELPKRNLLFNYIYCLIFILFLFLVFKSS